MFTQLQILKFLLSNVHFHLGDWYPVVKILMINLVRQVDCYMVGHGRSIVVTCLSVMADVAGTPAITTSNWCKVVLSSFSAIVP